MSSPVGSIYLVADQVSLLAVTFGCRWEKISGKLSGLRDGDSAVICRARTQLREYFARQRTAFDLPIRLHGTPFQQRAWQALLTIPYGESRSYSEQARLAGNPAAVRAVGRANSQNPLAIVVPCHRVIGKSGRLTGYAGGLAVKRFLLDLEYIDYEDDPSSISAER